MEKNITRNITYDDKLLQLYMHVHASVTAGHIPPHYMTFVFL